MTRRSVPPERGLATESSFGLAGLTAPRVRRAAQRRLYPRTHVKGDG